MKGYTILEILSKKYKTQSINVLYYLLNKYDEGTNVMH